MIRCDGLIALVMYIKTKKKNGNGMAPCWTPASTLKEPVVPESVLTQHRELVLTPQKYQCTFVGCHISSIM